MTDRPLAGVRVLEIGGGIPAAFATRWLVGFGADVVRAEGPREQLTADEEVYLLAGKRRIECGTSALRALALKADIVVEDREPGTLATWGMAPLDLRSANSALVIVSLTPFGQAGPYAHFQATNAVSFAMGGLMGVTGRPDREPLVTGGSQAQYLGGLNGFGAALTAYYGALIQGEGDWLDISLQECAAGMMEQIASRTEYLKTGPFLRAGNFVSAVWGIYELADGYGGVCALNRQIPAFFNVVGFPELQEERFIDPAVRFEHNDELHALLIPWFLERKKAELLAWGPQHKVPFGAVMTPADLLANESLAERSFFDAVATPHGEARVPGRPFLGFEWRAGKLSLPGADTDAVLRDWLGGGQ